LRWNQPYDFGIYNHNASAVVSLHTAFLKAEENIFVFKAHHATHGVVTHDSTRIYNYNASVVFS
jgi:hypothetical protein